MTNGLTFEIFNIIFYHCYDFNRKWPLQNFEEIGAKLTGKSPKIMQSWLIIFNLTATIYACRHIKPGSHDFRQFLHQF